MSIVLLSGLCALGLACMHIFAGSFGFLDVKPRSRWLSLAGGASVAYVFVRIFPELSRTQELVSGTGVMTFLEHHVYLLSLLGLVVFYGLERAIRLGRPHHHRIPPPDAQPGNDGVFWLHICSFSIYNFLIGYLLLHREQPGVWSLLLFFFAMALHFMVNDHGMRSAHRKVYDDIGRWVVAGAVVAGWLLGNIQQIHPITLGLLFAFLAGGVILNVLKEELPEEQSSSFAAFLAGTVGYTVIILMLL